MSVNDTHGLRYYRLNGITEIIIKLELEKPNWGFLEHFIAAKNMLYYMIV